MEVSNEFLKMVMCNTWKGVQKTISYEAIRIAGQAREIH